MHATPFMPNTEEPLAKYAVDTNLFRLGSTNPKKNIQLLDFFVDRQYIHHNKNYFSKKFQYLDKQKIPKKIDTLSAFYLSTLCPTTVWISLVGKNPVFFL